MDFYGVSNFITQLIYYSLVCVGRTPWLKDAPGIVVDVGVEMWRKQGWIVIHRAKEMCQLLVCENVVVALVMEAAQGCLGVAEVLLLSTREGAFCQSGLGVMPVEFVSAEQGTGEVETTGGKRDRGQA
ncbi:hypothetical protein BHM03_00003434 [Ensete ventricosum]|nr:hypothetical protein BHM03_00003434 [Ensete ventricosum]